MTIPRTQPYLTIFLFLALTAAAFPLVAQEEEAGPWSTQLELGFNGSSGNSSFSVLRTGAAMKFLNPDVAEFEVSALFRYGKSDSTVISNDVRGTVKFDWMPGSRFSPFAFVTASRDVIRRLDAKVNGGVGAKWAALRRDGTQLSLSAAGVIDYENYKLEAGSTDPESESTFRVSLRMTFDRQFGSGATFKHSTFWQPKGTDFADYNVEMTNSVSTQLLGNLTLALEHEYLHDEVPPTGVEPNDQKFSAVLRVIL